MEGFLCGFVILLIYIYLFALFFISVLFSKGKGKTFYGLVPWAKPGVTRQAAWQPVRFRSCGADLHELGSHRVMMGIPGAHAEIHQISWHTVDSNGLGAKTGRENVRKPQLVNVISCSFPINSHLFSMYLHAYLHCNRYILILNLHLTSDKLWQAGNVAKSFCIMQNSTYLNPVMADDCYLPLVESCIVKSYAFLQKSRC